MYEYNLTDPISAFISIETEEAYNNLATKDPCVLEIGGKESEIEEALEPTNIIWENYDMPWTTRALLLANIVFITGVVLGVTFLVSFKAKDEEQDLIGIYDNSITCAEVSKIYSYDELSKLAADEWVDYYQNGGEDAERQISENLACFCTAEYMRVGDDAAANLYLNTDGSKKVMTCAEFFDSKGKVVLIKMLVSFLIVGVNFALREILISLIKGMRLRTVTQETNYTMVGIFVGQFVNTALLLLFNSANFKDIDGGVGPLSAVFLVGDRTDFDVKWYSTVGAILMKTMFMVAIWPLIEFAMFYSLMNFNRLLDREWGSDTFVTNTPTVQAYIDLYAGAEYLIHYRYATILLNIGVAFFYGTAMPYLYATALLAFVVLYVNERLLVCYYYREPPAFDEKMTLMTLELSKYVPLMMLPVAFWQLGNRQIFDNQVEEIVYKSDPIMSGHSIQAALTHAKPWDLTYNTAPMILFYLQLAYIALQIFCWVVSSAEEDEDDQLVEGLSTYQEALKLDDQALVQGQEEYYKGKYGIETYSAEMYQKLKDAEVADDEHIIMGVATYRLLENIKYVQGFQYEPPKMLKGTPTREGRIFIATDESEGAEKKNQPDQQDVNYLAVFFAYIDAAKRKNVQFDTSAAGSNGGSLLPLQ